jgi:hypothetical protein
MRPVCYPVNEELAVMDEVAIRIMPAIAEEQCNHCFIAGVGKEISDLAYQFARAFVEARRRAHASFRNESEARHGA